MEYGYNEHSKVFFDLVMEGLKGEVNGSSFWEAIDDKAIFHFNFSFADFPKSMNKKDYLSWFEDYSVPLTSGELLGVYKDKSKEREVITLEYKVLVNNGAQTESFCSIIYIENKKIVEWHDYMNIRE